MNNIQIESIIKEIKDEIRKGNIINDIPSFDDIISGTSALGKKYQLSYMKKELEGLEFYEVRYYRALTSYNKKFAKPVVFIKRVIRKLLRFLCEPIVNEINTYNKRNIRLMKAMYELLNEGNTNEQNKLEQHKMKIKLRQMEEEIGSLKKEILELNKNVIREKEVL